MDMAPALGAWNLKDIKMEGVGGKEARKKGDTGSPYLGYPLELLRPRKRTLHSVLDAL